MGRAAKPTAKVPKADSVPISGLEPGKNSSPKTSAAAVPYKKKSYHSIVVPMKLAATTLRRLRLSSTFSASKRAATDDMWVSPPMRRSPRRIQGRVDSLKPGALETYPPFRDTNLVLWDA